VSPLFRKLKMVQGEAPSDAEEIAMQSELARLSALPLAQLATEVMAKSFGPSGGSVDGAFPDSALVDPFLPASMRTQKVIVKRDRPTPGHERDTYWQLIALLRDGLQVVERAGLVRRELIHTTATTSTEMYRITRLGQDALESDEVERIIRAAAAMPGSAPGP
jgi:hypothetical protein